MHHAKRQPKVAIQGPWRVDGATCCLADSGCWLSLVLDWPLFLFPGVSSHATCALWPHEPILLMQHARAHERKYGGLVGFHHERAKMDMEWRAPEMPRIQSRAGGAAYWGAKGLSNEQRTSLGACQSGGAIFFVTPSLRSRHLSLHLNTVWRSMHGGGWECELIECEFVIDPRRDSPVIRRHGD